MNRFLSSILLVCFLSGCLGPFQDRSGLPTTRTSVLLVSAQQVTETDDVETGGLPPKNKTLEYGNEDTIRVLIKVKGGNDDYFKFVDKARADYSTDRSILTGIPSKSVCAIRVANNTVYDQVEADPFVESIELDRVVTSLDMHNYRIVMPQDLPSAAAVDSAVSSGNSTDMHRLLQGSSAGSGQETIPYGIPLIQADLMWDVPQVDDAMQLCVVDTGMNLGHVDLPNARENRIDGTSTEAGLWPVDGNGHGTHTSGTVAAIGGNGIGVVGVRKNPNIQVFHAGRGLDDDGSGFTSTILSAVQGCVDSGARVISMSLGGPSQSAVEAAFYQDVYDSGILIVAAAGNSGDTGDLFPASYPTVMSVAAVSENSVRPGFSQCNSQVEIAAPGVDVLSTYPTNVYALSSGTSQACPHVAAVAAELMAVFPLCTNSQIRNVMLRTAKPIGEAQGCNNGYGSGLVQAMAAHDLLVAEGCTAGGEALERPSLAAVGGCEQNPDFVAQENPNRDQCPGGAGNAFLLSWLLVTTAMVVLSTSLLCDLAF